jgi:ABC-2 type transport system ATP-binding protein
MAIGDPAVQFRRVGKRFGSTWALSEVDLDIGRGEVVALLGPNGAGKSTAISLMLGLRQPTDGAVRILGQTPEAAVAEGRVAAMLQGGALPPGVSVRELVAFVRTLYPRPLTVDEALAQAACEAFADQRVERLSGGQQQRARFAMAVVGRPDLLFLDEPTVGFDVETRHRFWATVREVATDGRTILFCTHYLDEADAEAGRIVVLQHGRVVADGSGAAIKGSVAGRTVRLTMAAPDPAALAGLPGVHRVTVSGDRVTLQCSDGDAVVRALAQSPLAWRDLEVGGSDLEQAFVKLTADGDAGRDRA